MTRLPTLCQLNYDRDLPALTRVRAASKPGQIPCTTTCRGTVDFSRRLHENRPETTPYRYSSASFPPPGRDLPSLLCRDASRPRCNQGRAATADTSHLLPMLPSRGGLETSHTMNAECLHEPKWNRCLNAWVSATPGYHHAYFNIAGPLNLNNRGVFHFVREFDRIHQLPCERFEGHMHGGISQRRISKKTKKIIEKPDFWHWKGRSGPVIPKFAKPRPTLQDSCSPTPTHSTCAYATCGRICITLPVAMPPSPDNSCASSYRSDVPGFSPHSFFSELSSLSPFSSTSSNPVSPPESRVSANSVTTATSGIVSCDSFPPTTVPKTTPTSLSYLPAAPRLPSVVPWDSEDGWASDISSFHGEPAIVPLPADKRIRHCNIMTEHPILLEQLTVHACSLNAWSVPVQLSTDQMVQTNEGQTSQSVPNNHELPSQLGNNAGHLTYSEHNNHGLSSRSVSKHPSQSLFNNQEYSSQSSTIGHAQPATVKHTLVPPHPLVSSDMVTVDDVDRVTIMQAPLLHPLHQLPPAPPPRAATATIRSPVNEPKPVTPHPKPTQQPRKKKGIWKKQKRVVRKLVSKCDAVNPSSPLTLLSPTPDDLPQLSEEEDASRKATPVQIQEPPSPKLIEPTATPICTPTPSTPPPKTSTSHSPFPESYQRMLGMPDPSIGMELERQRRADERRRKALLMYENLKNRKGCAPGAPPASLTLMDSGWLAQFCIIKREKEYLYRRAFEAADDDNDGFLTCQEMLLALKGVANVNSLSDAEEEYVYRVLELAGYSVLSGADFKLFAVVAALTQKIASIDEWMKNLILRMDFKMLDMKVFRAKELFLWNVDEATNQLSLDRLMIELKAGGVSQEHQDEVQTKLGHLGALDILDFLTYLPLFLLMHSAVINNPFNTTRDK